MWVGVRLTDADCADASQTDRLLLARLAVPSGLAIIRDARTSDVGRRRVRGIALQEDVAAEAVKIRVGEPLIGFLREPQPFVYQPFVYKS